MEKFCGCSDNDDDDDDVIIMSSLYDYLLVVL